MSLEQAVKENTESLNEMIGLLKQDIELRKSGLSTVAAAIDKVNGKTAGTKAAETKAVETKTTETKTTAAAGGSDTALADAKTIIATYVGGTDRDDERNARKKKIVALMSNPKVKKDDAGDKVTDLKDVKPTALKAVIKKVQEYIDAGDLTTPPEAGNDEDEDLDLG